MALTRERLIPVAMEEEMRNSYLDYSMSVIVSRALPDVRDGLKPVQRRILYGMLELGLLPGRPFKKSARIVGEVLGKYHPHGDSAVYDAMVRMAQDWSMRYPLIEGQGNFGSIDGDSPAAMRYTEARLSPIGLETMRDIEKNTVDFKLNFDDSLQEPTVLPTAIPLLLANGASGIAVGMATNIPPHNLTELVDALLALIKNPDISIAELMKHIIAPDFPTGGIIYGYDPVREMYETGRGKIILRARANIETAKGGKQSIVITEIPFMVNKANLIEKIAELVRSKKLDEIVDIRDESDRMGLRIVLELRRDATPLVVLNNLYKHTQLQVTFGAILLALVNGRPKLLNLKQLLEEFLKFRNEVVVRRTQYELEAAEKRAHILEGFIIALDNIDEVIQLIKKSPDTNTASTRLQKRFSLTEIQAKAILDMRLQRLTGLERKKVQEEYKELLRTIERLRSILNSKELQMQEIARELEEIREKYGDERRTAIIYESREFTLEDMVANEDVIVTITHNGFIKRTPIVNYRRQSRGGRGSTGAMIKNGDYVEHIFRASTHHHLLFFTNTGRCYKVRVFDIPEGSRNARGRSIANFLSLAPEETITAYLPVQEFSEDLFILMATRKGYVKKTSLSEFANVRSNGIIAISLRDDDVLVGTRITDGTHYVLLGSKNGYICRFRESEIRPMGRNTMGVIGMRLDSDDELIALITLKYPDTHILTVSENGYGKRTPADEYRLTRRGAKGVIGMHLTQKTGKAIAMLDVNDSDDIAVMTTQGVLIRQPVSSIRITGRNAQGVRLIRLDDNDKIADVAKIPHEESEEESEEEQSHALYEGNGELSKAE